jgi:SLOG cluster3 family
MKRAIFLSASVPFREPFVSECDPVAIREAVLALVAVTVRERPLVFGGHPAISPLVEHAARSLGALKNVHIYQSRFFEDRIPEVARKFENLHWTERARDEAESLRLMRKEMIGSLDFCGGVFVGGMEGIFQESKWFGELQAGKPQLALGSTGGAAEKLLQEMRGAIDDKTYQLLQEERRYRRVFRQLLPKE